jgi:hypothetical protein
MTSKTNNLVILRGGTAASSENHAMQIAEFLGIDTAFVSVEGVRDIESLRQLVPPCAGLIAHADTLARLAETLDARVNGLLTLSDLFPHLFIYGFEATDRHANVLRSLSSGTLLEVRPLPNTDTAFQVSDRHREWCAQFSGLLVRTADPTRDACFVEGVPHDGYATLVQAAGEPFFVRVDRGTSEVFFVACRELGDLDENISRGTGLLPWFSRLVPIIIFLRRTLGKNAWHNDRPQACFIIDDPLLKQRYGFLEYSRVLEVMRGRKSCACIAFIPWNYRRSRKQTVDLFSAARPFLSLCIHGCDHTGAEFAATEYETLRDMARLALNRMQSHKDRCGLPFDDVMVFPQGLFSRQALKALDACGYLAAINTDVCPSDMPQGITLRDLLDVAVTKFGGFPLFSRHYPRDPAEFAFDLFLGKPALVVEHHGYFRDGGAELGMFVKRLNELDERLEWQNPATICTRACVRKVTPEGEVHVRFYANRFRLTNNGVRPEKYVLLREWTDEGALPSVTINGGPWAREQRGKNLAISLSLDPGQTADLHVLPVSPIETVVPAWKPTSAHNARVFVRRMLCEFRDNYMETNSFLRGFVSTARRFRTRKGLFRSASQAPQVESSR